MYVVLCTLCTALQFLDVYVYNVWNRRHCTVYTLHCKGNRGRILSVHSELMNIICPMEWRFSSIRQHIQLSTGIFCVDFNFSVYMRSLMLQSIRRPFIRIINILYFCYAPNRSCFHSLTDFQGTRKDQFVYQLMCIFLSFTWTISINNILISIYSYKWWNEL